MKYIELNQNHFDLYLKYLKHPSAWLMPDRVDIASQFLIDFPDFDVQPLADIKQYRAEMNQLAEI